MIAKCQVKTIETSSRAVMRRIEAYKSRKAPGKSISLSFNTMKYELEP
ncbi:hypothetical protein CJF31_00004146 [Rutstroemia sp. NJR-2017a BVV2]|nr:hypothetical protein CJF31_00004146 [Rutstroemia sp. NJR-2017a BVV2]